MSARIIAIAAGCALLVARPPLLRAAWDPTAALVLVFVALLVAGVAWPRPRAATAAAAAASSPPLLRPAVVLAFGAAAFAAGRLLGGGHPPASLTTRLVALNTLAAVAEEAFFRRLAYDALVPGGVAVAVGGSAALFALVHVTVYGAWVLPIDVGAGLVLSWQRWAGGSWSVPALTHVLANLLVVI